MTKNERRKLVYSTLLANGYSATESRKLRDLSLKKLVTYVKDNKKSITIIDKVGKKLNVPKEEIKELKTNVNFANLEIQKTTKGYLQKYNYIIRYEKGQKVRGRWTERTEHHMTIVSNSPMKKYEILQEFREFYNMDLQGYNAEEVISSSIKIELLLIKV